MSLPPYEPNNWVDKTIATPGTKIDRARMMKVENQLVALTEAVSESGTSITQMRPSVSTSANLPSTGNEDGDARVTEDDGHFHVWDGTQWTDSGPFRGETGPRDVSPTLKAPASRPTWLTTFQGGHGWASHSGTPATDDPAVSMMGSQSLAIPAGASAQKSGLGLDLTGKQLAFWFRADTTLPTDFLVYAGAPGLSSFYVWRIMRNTDPNPWFKPGEWAYVTLPFPSVATTGSPNRAAIDTVRIIPNGGKVWVNAAGITPDTTRYWPGGIVSLTFDDGYASDIQAARTVMTPRGVTGTSFIITDLVGDSGFMTEAEVIDLGTTHGWGIEAHGLPDYTSLTDEQLRAEFTKTKDWITSRGLGRGDHLAYPMGLHNERVEAVAREFFTTSRTISGHSRESWPPADPQRLRAVTGISSAAGGVSVATVKGYIDDALANGHWLVLVFHRIVSGTPAGTIECTYDDLAEICDYLNASQAEVRTVAEVAAARTLASVDVPEPDPVVPQTTYAVKAADQVVNNTTTLVDCTDLTFPVEAGGIYEVRGHVVYSTNAAADLKLGWSYPGSASVVSQWSPGGPAANIASATFGSVVWSRVQINGTASIGGVDGGIGARLVARPQGMFTASAAGNVTLQIAQAVVEASDTTVYAGSYLAVTKVN